jgi:hypothetical protein
MTTARNMFPYAAQDRVNMLVIFVQHVFLRCESLREHVGGIRAASSLMLSTFP